MLRSAMSVPALVLLLCAPAASAGTPGLSHPSGHETDVRARLLAAYPEAIAAIEANEIVWRDGTRMPLDDGTGEKPFRPWLDAPDVEDMLAIPYPAGAEAAPPARDSDPGRARNEAFFRKMYGDCQTGEVKPKLRPVAWLPTKSGRKIEVTTVNGVADRLAAVSRELDALPARFDKFLLPAAGTYNCRVIAGTSRVSAHGYAIAIDIAVAQSDYWRWAAKGADAEGGPATIPYRNRIPLEIVRIFEKHGFIWGGRWYHYDTMHFEYRPELLPPLAPLAADPSAAATPAANADAPAR